MMKSTNNVFFIGRPTPKAYSFDEKEPSDPQNPVVRGLVLHYLSSLVTYSPYVQGLLWSNAGFSSLRNRPEIASIGPRLDPTVIVSTGRAATSDTRDFSALLVEEFSSRLASGSEFPSTLDYHEAYKSGRLTPTVVAEVLLPLIRRDVKNPTEHSIAFVDSKVELVLKAADASTRRWKEGRPLSSLDGVPVAVKDEVDLSGYERHLGSKLDFTSQSDSTTYCVLQWEAAGAVIMGKLTMHEMGMDTTNCNPNYGTPKNPYNSNYYCGGSSGGSAYAVAAKLIPVALGADGGGSIRIPSAYCGIFGLKPSHNRISGRPTVSIATSVGVLGPMAANMIDLELSYRIMAQPDPLDPTAALFVPPNSVASLEKRRKVLGIDRHWFNRADAPVRAACQKVIDWLVTALGYALVDITIPFLHEGQIAHAMTIVCEVNAGLASVSELTAPNRVLLSVAGGQTRAIDLFQAQKVRNLLMEHLAHLYTKHPGMIIVSPTTPNAGWEIHPSDLEYGTSNGNMSIRSMTYVHLANFTGAPAITTPAGYVNAKGGVMPVGFMGMGEWCSDDELLAFGYDCERYLHEVLPGGRRRPQNCVDLMELANRAQ